MEVLSQNKLQVELHGSELWECRAFGFPINQPKNLLPRVTEPGSRGLRFMGYWVVEFQRFWRYMVSMDNLCGG